MSIGTIIYYLLWPIIAFTMLIHWIFAGVTFVMNLCVEYVIGFHGEIKEL